MVPECYWSNRWPLRALARSLAFYDGVLVFQWLRLPGDLAFLAGGVIVLVDLLAKLRHRRAVTVAEREELMPAMP